MHKIKKRKIDEFYLSEERLEILNGEIVGMASPSPAHAMASGNIFGEFHHFLKGKRCRVFTETDIHLEYEWNVFRPDVMIICNPEQITDKRISGTPDLVVEVLSPSTTNYDRTTKKDIYEKYGVKELWIVTPKEKAIEVYLLKDGAYKLDFAYTDFEPSEETEEHYRLEITTTLYGDDFKIKLTDIFES
ncbi:hypothetical protein FACS1894132_08550 [Clostridia bacterium]|nr:hypothetical protein FACS1894132_08550 [Clostridia bacterium]